jgi:O-antigen/teichoic acid export membrane protein
MPSVKPLISRLRAKISPADQSNLVRSTRLLLALATARATLFLAFMLLLRKMGATNFGTFFVGYNTMAFVPLIFDLGIGQTFVRHISFYRSSRPDFAAYLQWLFFVLKISSVAVLILCALPALPFVARFLNMQQQEWLLLASILGSGAVVLSDYVNSVFQSQCLFRRYELYLFLRNTVFLAAAIIVVVLKQSLLTPVVLITVLLTIHLGLAASGYRYVAGRWQGRAGEFSEFRSNLFRYSRWLTTAAVSFALYRRMDIYFLSHFRSAHEVGIYSIALVLVEPLAMISPALVTVFLPDISTAPTATKMRGHTRLLVTIGGLVLIGVCAYLAAIRLVLPYLPADYHEAFPVVAVLLLGTAFLIEYNMLSLVFLASDRPDLFGQIALTMAAFSLIANWFAVPAYGMLGAAGVYGICQALGIVVASFSVRRLLRERGLFVASEADLDLASESVLG